MTKSHFDETGAQWAWDSTSLKALYSCERLYAFQFIEDYVSSESSVHLVFGGIYAAALELYHRSVAQGAAHDEALHACVRYALVESWLHSLSLSGERIPNTGQPHPVFSTTNTKTREGLIRTIVWYLEHFRGSHISTLITSSGAAAVEYSFKLELSPSILYCGHIDRVVTDGRYSYIQDQKTTGATIGANYVSKYDLDIQMSGYTYAGKIIYNAPIAGVMIDAAQVATDFSAFFRGFTFRSNDALEEWRDESLSRLATIRAKSARYAEEGDIGVFAPNFTACTNYGGCPFAEVCAKPRGLRKRFLESNFTRRKPWNPLESR